ncbi:MAG: DUF3823 domain-containing protein [Bacteroides sp.]|nr:DUF3823 domain-containing protein [Bacteroides sp.]
MKTISKIFLMTVLSALALTSCTKDSYDAPTSFIKGRVVYQGEALQLRGNEAVKLDLYQRGYEKHDPVEVFVNQDGEFSICIFDGQYQLITRSGNGPWSSAGRDTIEINLKGYATQDVEVMPYYLVENAQMTLNGNKVDASFTVNKIAGTNIDRVFILLGTTQFLSDAEHNVDRYDETDNLSEFNETGKVYTFASRDYTDNKMFQTALKRGTLFGRICLWPQGSDQGIYSKVFRLK